MVTFNQAQTGNVVYGAGGTAPNRGQVSAAGAQGYIQRELNNQAKAGVVSQKGADGLSDRRSTVAAQSLNRMKQNGAGSVSGLQKSKLPSGGGAQTPDQLGIKQPSKPAGTTEIKITEDGQLQLPYTNTMSAGALEALEYQQQALMELNLQGQQQSAQYAEQHRLIDENERLDRRDNLNRNAASGTAFSSQYARDVDNTSRQYTQERADLELANTGWQNEQATRRAAIEASVNRILNMSAYDNVNELAEDAGNHGYGKDPLPSSSGNTLTTKIKNQRVKLKQAKADGKTKKAKAIKARIRRLVKERNK